jgi:hypothetical protein
MHNSNKMVACTFCRIRGISISIQAQGLHIRDMEDAEGAYSHERESKGQNISVGNVETKSNGHRSRVEPTELVETMRSLRMEVQSYRDDNEKIMRARRRKIK